MIEVILAFVVFAVLAVGAISLMNQGVAAAQRALEITLVRNQIDAQADTLRYIHDLANTEGAMGAAPGSPEKIAYDNWQRIAKTGPGNYADSTTSNFEIETDNTPCPDMPGDEFILNAHEGTLAPNGIIYPADSAPFSEVLYDTSNPNVIDRANGIWIEAKKTESEYVDFHIRACWYAAGGTPAILGTIVRLYDAI